MRIAPGTFACYQHINPETGEVFYIGHGSLDAGRPFRGGMWRTKVWNRYVKDLPNGYEVEHTVYTTKAEAKAAEIELIKQVQPVTNKVHK